MDFLWFTDEKVFTVATPKKIRKTIVSTLLQRQRKGTLQRIGCCALGQLSQGSVATRLRCGGQCDSQFVANFLMNSTMEKFRKSVNICQSYGQKYRGPFFDSQCISWSKSHSPRWWRFKSSISSRHCLSPGCILISSELTSRNSRPTFSIAGCTSNTKYQPNKSLQTHCY